jgi:hypothetical protein
MLRWRLPLWLRRLAISRVCRLAWQRQSAPPSDHAFFETHPAINGRWPFDVERGAIHIKPQLERLEGYDVVFVDGSRESIDVVIYATGFKISFPFMDLERLNWRNNRPELFLNVFHPERDDLFVAGLIQPDSGQFGLVDCQAQLIAAYILGLEVGGRGADRLQRAKRRHRPPTASGICYIDSPRHLLEVEHFSYRRSLNSWIRQVRPT